MSLLELKGVSVSFAGLKALTNVSFTLDAGQIGAVIGPNGAGKSTLFNAITGYVQLSAGSVEFDGRDLTGMPPYRISASGMRRTFQNGGAFGSMTVLENVLTGLNQQTLSSVAGIIFGSAGARRAEEQAVQRAEVLLDLIVSPPTCLRGSSALLKLHVRSLRARNCCCSTSRR